MSWFSQNSHSTNYSSTEFHENPTRHTHRRMGVSIRGISTECLNENQIEFRNVMGVICLQEMRYEKARRSSCAFYCVCKRTPETWPNIFEASSVVTEAHQNNQLQRAFKMSRHLHTNYFEEEIKEARRGVDNSSWLEGWAKSLMLISSCWWWMEEQTSLYILWWQQSKTALVNLIWPRNEIILESTLRNTLKIFCTLGYKRRPQNQAGKILHKYYTKISDHCIS